MTVLELSRTLPLRAVTLPDGERAIEGVYIGDLLSWVMGRAESGQVWITIMSNLNILAVATLSDVAAILVCEGVELDAAVIETATAKGINLLASPLPAYELAKKLAEIGL